MMSKSKIVQETLMQKMLGTGLPGALAIAALVLGTTASLADPTIRGAKAGISRSYATPARGQQPSQSGYYVPYVTGPADQKVPVMEIPGSVTIVPRQLMDDQQATTLGQALRNVSGVSVGH
jgi:outer membrane receptor for ferric coprogen and ferric-rhodotorulic acid